MAQGLTGEVHVSAARRQLLAIAPIRIVLGLVLLAASLAGASDDGPPGLAFLLGTFVVAFAALSDRRGLLLRGNAEPEPLPADAIRDPDWRVALAAAFPSTIAVSILAVIAIAAGSYVLAAGLAGAVMGLGVAAATALVPLVAWERDRGVRLHVGPRGRRFVA